MIQMTANDRLRLLAFTMWLSIGGSLAAADKPNIVYILSDDLGYGDLGCFNAASKIPTPCLDQLAHEGMRFTDAHAPSSVCTPTRYAILTGRYCWRTRLQSGVGAAGKDCLIAADRLTVGELLQQHGYATAAFGKWHLGWEAKTNDPDEPVLNGPTERGFDYFYGTVANELFGYHRNQGADSGDLQGRCFEGHRVIRDLLRADEYVPELARRASVWVENAAKSSKPFFLYLALPSPHAPVLPAAQFKSMSGAGENGDYVVATDWAAGQVLDAIQQAGIAHNTLVIFTSDNGPEITNARVKTGAYDRARMYGHYSMGPLRGIKRDLWEGGHRVPFLARWPGKIKAGTVCDETICHVDLMRTVAAMLDTRLPDAAAPDSVNILPALLGERHEHPLREATVHHSASGNFAIRKGDWVFIDAPSGNDNARGGEPEWFAILRGYTSHRLTGELFNVREDLAERHNRFAERPEVVKELKTLLEMYKENGRSTPGAPQQNDMPIGVNAGNKQRIK